MAFMVVFIVLTGAIAHSLLVVPVFVHRLVPPQSEARGKLYKAHKVVQAFRSRKRICNGSVRLPNLSTRRHTADNLNPHYHAHY